MAEFGIGIDIASTSKKSQSEISLGLPQIEEHEKDRVTNVHLSRMITEQQQRLNNDLVFYRKRGRLGAPAVQNADCVLNTPPNTPGTIGKDVVIIPNTRKYDEKEVVDPTSGAVGFTAKFETRSEDQIFSQLSNSEDIEKLLSSDGSFVKTILREYADADTQQKRKILYVLTGMKPHAAKVFEQIMDAPGDKSFFQRVTELHSHGFASMVVDVPENAGDAFVYSTLPFSQDNDIQESLDMYKSIAARCAGSGILPQHLLDTISIDLGYKYGDRSIFMDEVTTNEQYALRIHALKEALLKRSIQHPDVKAMNMCIASWPTNTTLEEAKRKAEAIGLQNDELVVSSERCAIISNQDDKVRLLVPYGDVERRARNIHHSVIPNTWSDVPHIRDMYQSVWYEVFNKPLTQLQQENPGVRGFIYQLADGRTIILVEDDAMSKKDKDAMMRKIKLRYGVTTLNDVNANGNDDEILQGEVSRSFIDTAMGNLNEELQGIDIPVADKKFYLRWMKDIAQGREKDLHGAELLKFRSIEKKILELKQ